MTFLTNALYERLFTAFMRLSRFLWWNKLCSCLNQKQVLMFTARWINDTIDASDFSQFQFFLDFVHFGKHVSSKTKKPLVLQNIVSTHFIPQSFKITIQILVLKTENTQADWITVSFYTQMGMPCYWPSLLYMKSIITNFLELLDFSRVHILEFQLYSAQYWFFWFKAN